MVRRGSRSTFNLVAPFHLRKLVKEEKFDILLEDINKIPFYTPFFLDIKTLVVIPHLFATTVFQEINPILGSYIYLAEIPMRWVYRSMPVNVISESTAQEMQQQWRTIYRSRSKEHDYLGGQLDHNRMRKLVARCGRDGRLFDHVARWIAREAARDFPNALALRVRLERFDSLPPEGVRAGLLPSYQTQRSLELELPRGEPVKGARP